MIIIPQIWPSSPLCFDTQRDGFSIECKFCGENEAPYVVGRGGGGAAEGAYFIFHGGWMRAWQQRSGLLHTRWNASREVNS